MSNLNKKNKRPTYQPKVKFQGNFTGEKEFIYDYTNPKGDFVSPGIKYFELSNGTYYEGENINNLATQIYKTKSEKTDNTYIINTNPSYVFSDIEVYNQRKNSIFKFQDNLEPIYSSKSFPTEKDYERGFFYRYVCLRKNSSVDIKEINKEIYDDISKREGRYDYNMYNVAKLKWGLLDGNIRSNKLQLRKLTQKGFFNLKFIFPNLSEFYLSTKTLQPKSLEEELSNPKLISNPKSESETGITESNPQIASIQQNVIDKIKDKTRKSKDKRMEKMLLKIRNNAKIKSTTNSPLKKSKTKQQNLGNSRGSGGNTSGGGGGGY
tara:strand:+ start:10611 stop:11576 length:966 start_codon:yes stop_codon:yes gene_type:complete